jgi:hypothetical protein
MQGRAAFLVAMAVMGGLTGCRYWGNDKPGSGTSDPGTIPTPTPTANRSPTITGKPVTAARVNAAYTFQPTASDADGDRLTFQVANKPAWATFDPATGRLYGTPSTSSSGTFGNVQITVTDGKASAALPPFTIAVADVAITANATLYWQPPTTNSDGSALTDLSGYTIRYGSNVAVLDKSVTVSNPGVTTYVIENLSAGTWYFSLSAVNKSGVASNLASPVSITIG